MTAQDEKIYKLTGPVVNNNNNDNDRINTIKLHITVDLSVEHNFTALDFMFIS